MSDRKRQTADSEPNDEDIAEEAARLSAKWAQAAKAVQVNGEAAAPNGAQPVQKPRTAVSGPIVQTLEKGRTHMVTVEVKRRRGKKGPGGSNGQGN